MPDSQITVPGCDSESMSYYINTRDTIHGLDKLIASAIYQSVTMITASLTLAVVLYEKIDNPLHSTILALLLTIIAFIITFNVQRRIKFYSDLLTQAIGVALKLENSLISDDQLKLTLWIERNVPFAKIGGVIIYLTSTKVFYLIEAILFFYFSINAVIMLLNN
jgi:hypothetical protein